MSTSNDVVETLLDVDEGDQLDLKAEYYSWGSDFEVETIDEQVWEAATGGQWRSRRLLIEPSAPRANKKRLTLLRRATPPHVGQYGALTGARPLGERNRDAVDWTERPPDEIVETSSIPRTLPEVLDAVEGSDTVIDVHQRVAANTIAATKRLLWELGLRDQSGQLLEDDELQERIETLREVADDE